MRRTVRCTVVHAISITMKNAGRLINASGEYLNILHGRFVVSDGGRRQKKNGNFIRACYASARAKGQETLYKFAKVHLGRFHLGPRSPRNYSSWAGVNCWLHQTISFPLFEAALDERDVIVPYSIRLYRNRAIPGCNAIRTSILVHSRRRGVVSRSGC